MRRQIHARQSGTMRHERQRKGDGIMKGSDKGNETTG